MISTAFKSFLIKTFKSSCGEINVWEKEVPLSKIVLAILRKKGYTKMACIWLFSICTGSAENAAQVEKFFDQSPVKGSGRQISLFVKREEWKGESYLNIYPFSVENDFWLWPDNGPSGPEEALEMTGVGQELINRLHHLPTEARYLFATLGVECNEWRSSKEVAELIREWDYHEPIGIVVSEDIWKRGGSRSAFREFSPGYRFDGWSGEKFEE